MPEAKPMKLRLTDEGSRKVKSTLLRQPVRLSQGVSAHPPEIATLAQLFGRACCVSRTGTPEGAYWTG